MIVNKQYIFVSVDSFLSFFRTLCNNDQCNSQNKKNVTMIKLYATAVNVIQIVKIRNFVFIIKKCDTKKTQLYIYTL